MITISDANNPINKNTASASFSKQIIMILKKRILKKRLGSLDQMLVSALAFIIEATLIVAVVNILIS